MKHVEKPCDDENFVCERQKAPSAPLQRLVHVLDQVAQQADLVDECRQVVVQEQRPLHEEVGEKVHQVAQK